MHTNYRFFAKLLTTFGKLSSLKEKFLPWGGCEALSCIVVLIVEMEYNYDLLFWVVPTQLFFQCRIQTVIHKCPMYHSSSILSPHCHQSLFQYSSDCEIQAVEWLIPTGTWLPAWTHIQYSHCKCVILTFLNWILALTMIKHLIELSGNMYTLCKHYSLPSNILICET